MPGSHGNAITNPTSPWGANWLLDPNASAGLDDLGCSTFIKTLPGAADSGALLRLQNLPWYNTTDYATINALVAAAGAGPYVIHASAHKHVTANLTLGSGIYLAIDPGVLVEVDNGFTLTIHDPHHVLAAATQPIFTLTGTGLVGFTDGGEIWAGWWGLSTANAAADNATAMNATLAAGFANHCDVAIAGSENTVYACGQVAYSHTGGSHINGITIRGVGRPVFDHSSLAGANIGWSFLADLAGAIDVHLTLQNLILNGPDADASTGAPTTTTVGLRFEYCYDVHLEHVQVQTFRTGVYWTYCWPIRTQACIFTDCYIGVDIDDACTIGWHNSQFDGNFHNLLLHGGVTGQTFDCCLLQNCGGNAITIDPETIGGTARAVRGIIISNPYFESVAGKALALLEGLDGVESEGKTYDVLVEEGVWSSITGAAIAGSQTNDGDVHSVTILNSYGVDAIGDISGYLRNSSMKTGNTSYTELETLWDNSGNRWYPVRRNTSGRVGIGTAVDSPDALLHVQTADTSTTPDADADEAVFENNGKAGFSVLSSDAQPGKGLFGGPSQAAGGQIYYYYNGGSPVFAVGTLKAGGTLELRAGNNTVVGIVTNTDLRPGANDSYYLGKNSSSDPMAWKGLIVKDDTNGNYYRIGTHNGSIAVTLL